MVAEPDRKDDEKVDQVDEAHLDGTSNGREAVMKVQALQQPHQNVEEARSKHPLCTYAGGKGGQVGQRHVARAAHNWHECTLSQRSSKSALSMNARLSTTAPEACSEAR